MQTEDQIQTVADAPASQPLSLISDQLETARAIIETRFSDAGGRLAGSLDIVSQLIESLDHLGAALNADAVSRTTSDLLATAEGLTALPEAQKGRLQRLTGLRGAGAALAAHIDEMRQTLRYLRAFAMNVKITAGSTIGGADEFAGFADRMCGQLDVGGAQLDELAVQLTLLDQQLSGALTFEQGLVGKYQTVIPVVPDRLAVDAQSIGAHHAKIAEVAATVARIARDIQMRVARALTAMQIGDITRQRIEHVQTGLMVTERILAEADLAPDAKNRARARLVHMLAEQMADIADCFETEAAKVSQSLEGMAQDTTQILAFQGLSDARGSGGLRALETSLGEAHLLVGEVGSAMDNAHRISHDTARAVEALSRRIDAIQGVKRDIQQMAINSSLRCNRLGEVGKPLNVIALELSIHAGELENAADQTLTSLTALARMAGEDAPVQGEALDASRLESVRDRLRQAADVIETDLDALNRRGAETARSLQLATHQLGLKQDLGDTLHTAAYALAQEAGPPSDDLSDIAGIVTEAMNEIGRCYTMAGERTIHARHAIETPQETPLAEAAPSLSVALSLAPSLTPDTGADEFDDVLF